MGWTNWGCYGGRITATLSVSLAILFSVELRAQLPSAMPPFQANGVAFNASSALQSRVHSSDDWSPGFASIEFPPLNSFSCASGLNGGDRLQSWHTQSGPGNPQAPTWQAPQVLVMTPTNKELPPGYGSYSNGAMTAPQAGCVAAVADACMGPNSCYRDNACLANCYAAPLPSSLVYGGFEFLWMRAHFDQNVAMIIDPPIGNTLKPFDYDFDFTPRTWFGWQSPNGGGLRATFWRFDGSATTERRTAVVGATPVYLFVYGAGGNLSRNAYADLGETLVSNHSLTMQALDLEVTQCFALASLQCLAGVGVRLADMDQHLRGEVYSPSNVLWEIVTNDLLFQGVGPTASLQLRRPVRHSRFSFTGGLRGAFLFSDTHQGIYEMKDGFTNEVTDVAEQTEILSVGELALGLQYSHCIGRRAEFFVRGNYECQAWFDVGGPVDSHSTVAFDGIGLATGVLF